MNSISSHKGGHKAAHQWKHLPFTDHLLVVQHQLNSTAILPGEFNHCCETQALREDSI